MFGLFKRKKEYTLLSAEMMTPLDAEIPTTQAKKIYRAHMQTIELFSKEELSDRVFEFGEEIKYKEETYRDDIQDCKDEIRRIKTELAELKKQLKSCNSEEEREGILEEIAGSEEELVAANEDLEKEKEQLKKFRADKRFFLIKYVNDEIKNETAGE